MTKVTAEGSELILRNSDGTVAVIPKNRREDVLRHIRNGNHGAVDDIVNSLPHHSDYAADGSVFKGRGAKCLNGIHRARLFTKNGESKLFNSLQERYDSADTALSVYNRITGDQYTAIASMENGEPVVKDGYILTKNGGKVAIDHKPISSTVTEMAKASPFLSDMVSRLERLMPGVRIELVDSEEKGAVGNNTIRFNMEKFTPDTPFHELAHPLLKVIQRTNRKAYLNIEQEVKSILKANPSLQASIADKYSTKNEKQQMEEAIATIVGLLGADMVGDLNPTGSIEENQRLWDRIKSIVATFYEAVEKTIRTAFGLPSKDRITQLSTIRDVAKYVKDMLNEKEHVPQSILDTIAAMDMEYSHPLSITSTNDLKSVLFGTSDVGIDEQVRRIMMSIRSTPYGKTVFVGGERYRFDNSKSDTEIESFVRNQLSMGIDQTAELKDKLVEWINVHRMSLKNEDLARLFGSNENGPMVSRRILKSFMRTMDLQPGDKVYRFSQIQALPSITSEMSKHFISEIQGYDPLVVVNHDEEGRMIVSLYDPTLSKTYEAKNVGRLQSIWHMIAGGKSAYLQNNELGYRRLMLALAANFLMSASDGKIQVKESIVVGVTDYHNQLHGGFDANMVDMVRANQDIKRLGKVKLDSGKTIAESFDNIVLKGIFNGTDLHVDRADYWTLLMNFWGKQDADFLNRRGLDVKGKLRMGMTVPERREIILKQLRYIKDQYTSVGPDGSYMMGEERLQDNIEFKYLVKELQNIQSLNVVDYQMNSRQRLNDFTKLISPTHSINDERLTTFKMAVREIINRLYTKIADHGKFLNTITDVYTKTYGDQFRGRLSDRFGDKLYEPAVAVVTMIDENGNKHSHKLNHLLWTTDEKKDPMLSLFPELKIQAQSLPKEILEANERLCDAITEKMVDVMQHISMVHGNEMSDMSREDARKNLFGYTAYRKGYMPIMSKSVNSMLWSEGVKAAWDKQTSVWANFNSSYDQMSHEEQQMNREYDTITSSFIDQLGLFGSSYTVLTDPKTGAKLNLTKKQMDLLGVTLTEKGDFVSVDRGVNGAMTTNLEMVVKNFMATMDRKIDYESHIIPLYHGIRAVLADEKENKGAKDNEALEEWIELFCDSVVFGRGKEIKNAPTVNAAIVGTTKFWTATTMAGNIGIGLASSLVNMWGSLAETLSTNAYGMFKASDVVKASTWCIAHPLRAFQLAFHYRVANMNEHDAVNFYLNNKTKKNLFSDFWIYFPNWVSDTFCRSVLLVAKMKADGSFDAHSFNDKGEMVYDIKKDKRFYKSGSVVAGMQPYIDNLKQQLHDNGMAENYGYDYREQQSLRSFIAKHIIGAFDAADKAQISSFVLSKPFMMFRTYVTSKADNLIAEGQYIDEMGKWVYNEKEEMMQWERVYFEGQLRTIKALFDIARAEGPFYKGLNPVGIVKGYGELNEAQKNNIKRMLVKAAMFAALSIAYALATSGDDDDKDKLSDRKLVKTFKYSYQDLLSFGWIYQAITNPSAASSMIERLFDQRYGDGWRRVLNTVKPVMSVDQVYNLFTGDSFIKPSNNENK